METDNTRISRILSVLSQTYPNAAIVLRFSTPWELLVAVILSAQCTDVRVNIVTKTLFAKYKTLDDYVHADIKEFENAIKSTGFYHNKAKNILASARLIQEKFGGKIPNTMQDLLTLPGVARKTANVVLGNAYGVVEGIAVDTHVHRLSQRLRLVNLDTIGGKKIVYFQRSSVKIPHSASVSRIIDYTRDADPVKIEKELMSVIPKSEWFILTYLLIEHGRAICKAVNPKCETCILNKLCPVTRL